MPQLSVVKNPCIRSLVLLTTDGMYKWTTVVALGPNKLYWLIRLAVYTSSFAGWFLIQRISVLLSLGKTHSRRHTKSGIVTTQGEYTTTRMTARKNNVNTLIHFKGYLSRINQLVLHQNCRLRQFPVKTTTNNNILIGNGGAHPS